MADKAKESSKKSTESSSDRRRANTGSRQSTGSLSNERVPSQVSITDIAQQLCFWASQSNKDGSPITVGSTLSKEAFGKPKRLYSEIETRAEKDNLTINSFSHKFPIREIFFNKNEAEQHTVPLANGSSITFNTGIIHINATDLELTRRDANGDITATIKQEASFNIKTGEINFRLKEERAKILYESKYIVDGLFTSGARIKLNPYTVDPIKQIHHVQRTKTILTKLNKTKVNIYSYLNSKASGTNVTFSSTLTELKTKLEQLRRRIVELERMIQSQESQLEISQFKYVEKVLKDEESLKTYKRDLFTWYENYKLWSFKPELIAPTIESHQYILEFRKTGKPRLSKYMEKLVTRTMPYDSRITMTEDTEVVTDYINREFAERAKRRDDNEVKKITDSLAKAQNQVERERLTKQLKKAKDKASKTIEERMQRTDTIKTANGFGLYTPYLLSDILRYGSVLMKSNIIDGLALSSQNIGIFADNINGFKSLVFNFVSLFNQIVLHKITNAHLCTNILNDVADVIIRTGYNSKIYSNLSWLYLPGADGSVPTYTIGSDITHPLRFMPCMGSTGSLNILKELKDEYLPKTRDLALLSVDEPLMGSDEFGDIQDFDVIFSEQFKSTGILGALSALVFNPLVENFEKLLELKYDYTEDIGKEDIENSLVESDESPNVGSITISLPESTTETSTSTDILSSMEVFQSNPASETPKPVSAWAKGPSSLIFQPLTPEQKAEQEARIQQERRQKQEEIERRTQAELQAKAARRQRDIEMSILQDDESSDMRVSNTKAGIKVDSSSESESIVKFPIKYITSVGQIKIGTKTNILPHNFIEDNIVEITFDDDAENQNHQQFAGRRFNVKVIDEFTLLLKRFTNINGSAPIRFKEGNAFITRIPDELISESHKEMRIATKHEGDKHTESPLQWATRREKLRTADNLRIFNFSSIGEMNADEERAIINTLVDKVQNSMSKKSFSRMGDEEIKDIIRARIIALKESNLTNFKKQKINELGVLVSRNITEVPDHSERERKDFEVENTMVKAGNKWANELIEKARLAGHNVSHLPVTSVTKTTESSERHSKGSNKNKKERNNREKYLKYKAKYLALKAKLGL